MKYWIGALVLSAIPFISVGAVEVAMKQSCSITPQMWELKVPSSFVRSNNLRRMSGEAEFAQGTPTVIEGHIYDANCVPISDAIVELWQANALGGFEFNRKPRELSKHDPYFAGSGVTTTDNLGYYKFLTVFPGSISGDRAPHVNFRVRKAGFFDFEGIMYFDNNPKNAVDKVLNKDIPSSKRDNLIANQTTEISPDIEGSQTYSFDIVLEGRNKFKKY